MTALLSQGCLVLAVGLMVALSVIDLKHKILPNELVFAFAVVGVAYHALTHFAHLPLWEVCAGGLGGYAVFYGLRAAANAWYGQDAFGMGDVKFMGAAGLWLGPVGLVVATSFGAIAGLFHGVLVGLEGKIRRKEPFDLTSMKLPAGPGFAVGIFLSALDVLGFVDWSEMSGGFIP